MKKLLIALVGIILLSSCVQQENQISTPKNVILLIGDGMGIAQVYSGYIAQKGKTQFDRFPYTGLTRTYSFDKLITDSGAAGTALSSGIKTRNHMIGMNPDTIPVKSILHYSEDHNKSTGVVATSSVTHATPASFIAHEPTRYNYEEIAADFLDTDVDVFIGGGLDHFTKRKDGRNLISELESKDYSIAYNLAEIKSFQGSKLAGFLYDEHPPYYALGRGEMLFQSSKKAIEILKQNPKGFFLMIEASQIDWAGHFKDSKLEKSKIDRESELYQQETIKFSDILVQEILDFERTIGYALDFAESNKETLIIVIADHETGGYAITDGCLEKGEIYGEFVNKEHTATMVPVFAFGPGSEKFTGIMENTDVFQKMHTLMGYKN